MCRSRTAEGSDDGPPPALPGRSVAVRYNAQRDQRGGRYSRKNDGVLDVGRPRDKYRGTREFNEDRISRPFGHKALYIYSFSRCSGSRFVRPTENVWGVTTVRFDTVVGASRRTAKTPRCVVAYKQIRLQASSFARMPDPRPKIAAGHGNPTRKIEKKIVGVSLSPRPAESKCAEMYRNVFSTNNTAPVIARVSTLADNRLQPEPPR